MMSKGPRPDKKRNKKEKLILFFSNWIGLTILGVVLFFVAPFLSWDFAKTGENNMLVDLYRTLRR